MIYKIPAGSELYTRLTNLQKRINSANKSALDICKAIAGKDSAPFIHPKYIAGGIDAIHIPTPPSKLIWRKVGGDESNFYYPRNTNVHTLNLLSTLPRVTWADLNSILGYFGNQTINTKKGKMIVRGAEIGFLPDTIIIKIHPKTKYTPLPEMEEITEEELQKLQKS